MTFSPINSDIQSSSPISSHQKNQRIGLIAGNGRFPIIFSENAHNLGYSVSAVAHIGETSPELEQYVDRIHWVRIGQFNKIIQLLKNDGVQQAVMLGGINKTHLFSIRPDRRGIALLSRLKVWKDDSILRAIAAEIETEGIQIRESTFGLQNILVHEGVLTKKSPTTKEMDDVKYGWKIAQEIGALDIGQCVVVRKQVIVAVEAVEGTDATIRRGGLLACKGAVLVKRCKPQQDLRFDLPSVGPQTISVMKEVKATVLALEAHKTILLDREEMIKKANGAGIAIIGLRNASHEF